MLLGISIVYAEIREGRDQFTDGKWRTSGNFLDNQQWIGLRKISDGEVTKYEILFSEKELKYVKFSEKSGEIKIDDKPVSQLQVGAVSSRPALSSGLSHLSLTITVSSEQIKSIETAQRVALKFRKTDGTSTVLVLPDAVLAEWKEVINTEK
ncbi:hypothetical protein SAMN04488502_11525 [Dendrosporobacter quercicolus]|uniref:Uncharacterized protein n=2 Tax=Dendrosporobacter quercicolus TaxID=146817 RepID=A0A1G9ZR64_9FIRM|nr:hypothetical protein SAMN04488502_11525 [Dendrosporobacter quercicolus]